MKKSLTLLMVLITAFAVQSQTLRTYKVDNFSAADSIKAIATRGPLGAVGAVIGRPTSGDSLGWIVPGTVTSVGATTPLASSGGATPTISINGLTTNGTSGQAVTSSGSGLQYETYTGSGSPVRATSPTLVTPILGTPTSVTLTNATGLPVSTGISGLGTGIATFLATPSSANFAAAVTGETGTGAVVFGTSPTLVTPNLGTPSAATLTNATGLPISTGVSGLGTGVATFLATPSSANLASALTDETGSGAAVFAASPTFTGTVLASAITATGNLIFGTSTSSALILDAAGSLGFFGEEPITQPAIGTLTAYNPVTQTSSFLTQYQALLTALGNATGLGLVKP